MNKMKEIESLVSSFNWNNGNSLTIWVDIDNVGDFFYAVDKLNIVSSFNVVTLHKMIMIDNFDEFLVDYCNSHNKNIEDFF